MPVVEFRAPYRPMTKMPSIQALRGLAVLSVVAFHAQIVERKYSGGDALLPAFLDVGRSGVDLFFVISGFVMVMVTHGRAGQPGETGRFLWGRVSRIYPTYWFYFALVLAVLLVKPEWVNASQGNEVRLVSSFLLWPSDRLPLVLVAWSLIHELWFYLVFAMLLKARRNWLAPLLLAWASIVVGATLFAQGDWSPALRVALHPYSLEFIIGALAAIFHFSRLAPHLPPVTAWMGLVVALAAGVPLLQYSGLLNGDDLRHALGVGGLYGVLLISLVTLESAGKVPAFRFLGFVGDISYTVYLSHVLVLGAVGHLWQLTSPAADSLVDNTLVVLAMSGAVLGYGFIGFRLIEQPMLRTSHRLRSRWFARSSEVAPQI